MDLAGLQREVEAISALYARRFDIDRTDDWLLLKLNEEVGELTQAYLARTGQARRTDASPEHFDDEIADVLAHLLLIAERFGVDVAAAMERKWLAWKADLDED
ncbi:MazG nucleotide pyrophosphohydrolase domain-containing protein [Microbacterium aoyamense]|uniref:MazG nucleotide pyrophosphohydrolase domain-containing protein n=1 Tax=Microbacterium aoyamense TaxID=344166 RepID=A0ABP5BC09_9MICO|nr:pyrophosphatase [Microbacterium aoyamense]